MQGIFDVGVTPYWLIPILGGLSFGYLLGGWTGLTTGAKLTIMPVFSILGGYFTASILSFSLSVYWSLAILSILSFFGGGITGMILNWRVQEDEPHRRAIHFHPEDDEEFDRQIRDVFGDEEE